MKSYSYIFFFNSANASLIRMQLLITQKAKVSVKCSLSHVFQDIHLFSVMIRIKLSFKVVHLFVFYLLT